MNYVVTGMQFVLTGMEATSRCTCLNFAGEFLNNASTKINSIDGALAVFESVIGVFESVIRVNGRIRVRYSRGAFEGRSRDVSGIVCESKFKVGGKFLGSSNGGSGGGGGTDIGVLIGGIVGGVLLLGLAIGGFVFYRMKKKPLLDDPTNEKELGVVPAEGIPARSYENAF